MRVVLESYTFLYSRQDNKWCSLKMLNFWNNDKQTKTKGVLFMWE